MTSIVKKHNADYYYKAFKAKTQLITVLFGIFSRCDSMTEICEGLRAMGGKLNHLGLEKAPDKIKGANLSTKQKENLAAGKKVTVEGMTSKDDKKFSAALQIDAASRKIGLSDF